MFGTKSDAAAEGGAQEAGLEMESLISGLSRLGGDMISVTNI